MSIIEVHCSWKRICKLTIHNNIVLCVTSITTIYPNKYTACMMFPNPVNFYLAWLLSLYTDSLIVLLQQHITTYTINIVFPSVLRRHKCSKHNLTYYIDQLRK